MSNEMKADHWRGLDFYDPENDKSKYLIIGDGNIGSYVLFALARMGAKNINVIDFDVVEGHNLPNQFFNETEIAQDLLKITASEITLKHHLGASYPSNLNFVKGRIENHWGLIDDATVIIVAVDDMSIRARIWSHMRNQISKRQFLVDCRTGGLFANVYSVDTYNDKDCENYNKSLHTNGEASDLPCSGRNSMDVTFTCVGLIINQIRTFVTKGSGFLNHILVDMKLGKSEVFGLRKLPDVAEEGESIDEHTNS